MALRAPRAAHAPRALSAAEVVGVEARAAHALREVRGEPSELTAQHVRVAALELGERLERPREVEVERVGVVAGSILLERPQVDEHGLFGEALDGDLGPLTVDCGTG